MLDKLLKKFGLVRYSKYKDLESEKNMFKEIVRRHFGELKYIRQYNDQLKDEVNVLRDKLLKDVNISDVLSYYEFAYTTEDLSLNHYKTIRLELKPYRKEFQISTYENMNLNDFLDYEKNRFMREAQDSIKEDIVAQIKEKYEHEEC